MFYPSRQGEGLANSDIARAVRQQKERHDAFDRRAAANGDYTEPKGGNRPTKGFGL